MIHVSFVARNSRGKLAGLLFGAILLTTGAVIGIRAPAMASRPVDLALCWAGVVFFPFGSLILGRQLFLTGPIMEIGPIGLRWRRWSDEWIPWRAFVRARPVTIKRQRFLALWFRDPGTYRSNTSIGRSAAVNRALGYGDVALTALGTDRRYEEIEAAVRIHAPQLFDGI
ncbi:MAG: STM3941 family protein [Sphingomonas sp.]